MKTIELTQGAVALVCNCHYDLVKDHKWHLRKNETHTTGYAESRTSSRGGVKRWTLRMSHLILAPRPGFLVDHKDGDSLNNQCSNLRLVTPSQNSINMKTPSNNKSGVKGVCWSNYVNSWRASIMFNGKQKFLGHFDNLEDAKKVRLDAEKKYHGEYTRAE